MLSRRQAAWPRCGASLARLRRVAARDEAQSTMEMALSLVLTVGTVFLVLEFSLMAYTYAVMNDAVREGVRYAIVHGTFNGTCSGPGGPGSNNTAVTCGDSSAANVKSQVTSYAASSLHSLPSGNVTVNYLDSSSSPAGDSSSKPPLPPLPRVQVSISYQYVPFIHYPGVAPTITVSAEGRIVN